MKYPKLKDGEAMRVDTNEEDLGFACCDCGLTHTFQFHNLGDGIYDIAIFSNNRTTAQLRRYKFGYLQQGLRPNYKMTRKNN